MYHFKHNIFLKNCKSVNTPVSVYVAVYLWSD